jgi:hypothetical protein
MALAALTLNQERKLAVLLTSPISAGSGEIRTTILHHRRSDYAPLHHRVNQTKSGYPPLLQAGTAKEARDAIDRGFELLRNAWWLPDTVEDDVLISRGDNQIRLLRTRKGRCVRPHDGNVDGALQKSGSCSI